MKSVKRSVSGRSTLAAVESLEGRVMLAAHPSVLSVSADDQGQAIITLNMPLNPTTVNTNSVLIYTAPAGFTDPTASNHNQQNTAVSYNAATNQITVTTLPNLHPAPVNYEVVLKGSIITAKGHPSSGTGFHLIGGTPSGAATGPGTRYGFVTSIDSNKVAQFDTSLGEMSFQLQPRTSMPATIRNFIQYVNSGAYDGTFFHRLGSPVNASDPLGVLQAGGFDVSGNTVETIPTSAAINLERGISNTIGTIAMARSSSPNSATDQFFINYVDNRSELDEPGTGTPTSGYAAFGTITSGQGEQVMQALAGESTVNMESLTGSVNSSFYSNTGIQDLPVLNSGLTPAEVDSNLQGNLVFITRVAMEATINSVTFPSTAPTSADAKVVSNNVANDAAASIFASSAPIGDGGTTASELLTLLGGDQTSIL